MANTQNRLVLLVKKAITVLQKRGLSFLIRKALKTSYLVVTSFIKYSSKRTEYRAFLSSLQLQDRIFLWTERFGWNIALFQRPQHIARCLAARGSSFFYYTEPEFDPDVKDIKQIGPNLFLVNRWNLVFVSELERCLFAAKQHRYVHTYSTLGTTTDELKRYESYGFHVFYEYVDDLSPELSGTKKVPAYLMEKYEYVTGSDRIPVAATADLLVQQMRDLRGEKNLVQSSNGVDPEHFRNIKEDFVFSDMFQKVLDRGNKIVGYYGAMAKWLDYDLLKYVAAQLPDVDFVLIGKKYDDSFDASGIDTVPNIHFIGPVAYQDLPQYAAKFDICSIPFVVNSITNATSPLKLFEYMALRKPVLTTAMQESSKYEAVNIAHDPQEFADQIRLLLSYAPATQPGYFALLDETVAQNDWLSKADLILNMLEDYESSL